MVDVNLNTNNFQPMDLKGYTTDDLKSVAGQIAKESLLTEDEILSDLQYLQSKNIKLDARILNSLIAGVPDLTPPPSSVGVPVGPLGVGNKWLASSALTNFLTVFAEVQKIIQRLRLYDAQLEVQGQHWLLTQTATSAELIKESAQLEANMDWMALAAAAADICIAVGTFIAGQAARDKAKVNRDKIMENLGGDGPDSAGNFKGGEIAKLEQELKIKQRTQVGTDKDAIQNHETEIRTLEQKIADKKGEYMKMKAEYWTLINTEANYELSKVNLVKAVLENAAKMVEKGYDANMKTQKGAVDANKALSDAYQKIAQEMMAQGSSASKELSDWGSQVLQLLQKMIDETKKSFGMISAH